MQRLKYFLLPIIILMTTCNQDPIFYAIFQEVKPTIPRIKGTPTNMVVFERNGKKALYVASGEIHWYAKKKNTNKNEDKYWTKWWDQNNGKVPQPGGKVVSLAATDTHLYALCLNTDTITTELKRISNTGSSWKTVPIKDKTNKYSRLQSVFASNGKVFVGARLDGSKENSIPCAILYLDDENKLAHRKIEIKIKKDDATETITTTEADLINGVAWDGNGYYLSAKNLYSSTGSIYYISESDLATPSAVFKKLYRNSDLNTPGFMNILSLENGSTTDIVAIDRDGWLYSVKATGFTSLNKKTNSKDKESTDIALGALALWRNKDDTAWGGNWKDGDPQPLPALLLVSIQETNSSTYGYRETDLVWNTDQLATSNLSFRKPGDLKTSTNDISTVDNEERYGNTIGTHVVYHIFQTPRDIDEEMPLFASTSTSGLWSYRLREKDKNKKEWQWNAEEE